MVLDTGGHAALFAVLDGLGHGASAATAAEGAVAVLAENPAEPLDVLMVLCHRALADTRGAAVTLALVDTDDQLQWLGVGNVAARVVAAGPGKPLVRATALLAGGIVGYLLPPNLQVQGLTMRAGDVLLMSTDGIVDEIVDDVDLSRSTTDLAARILDRHAKDTDDALVLAARHRGHRAPLPQ